MNTSRLNHEVSAYLTYWVGDYHAPRLVALSRKMELDSKSLLVAQFTSRSLFYTHRQSRRESLLRKILFDDVSSDEKLGLAKRVWKYLQTRRPGSILVLGYNDQISLISLLWAKLYGAKIYFCSDSKQDDQPRNALKEVIKRRLISRFDGALVAGEKHRDYFRALGCKGRILTGYDVVDNDYFNASSRRYRTKAALLKTAGLGAPYVLCVSRTVERKRIPLALDIFSKSGLADFGYKFLLIGDGPLNDEMDVLGHRLLPQGCFVHIKEVDNKRMPLYYAFARMLVLASEYDQWGLCVNEAMACGVPVLVTERCGCAEIVEQASGFVFDDKTDIAKVAEFMRSIGMNDDVHQELSKRALESISRWNVDKFANSAGQLLSGRAD